MIKVEAIKFGSAVNTAGTEFTFIQDTKKHPHAKVEVLFDPEKGVFVLYDKRSSEETIVFPTNVQWARFHKDADESKQGSGGSSPKRTGKTA